MLSLLYVDISIIGVNCPDQEQKYKATGEGLSLNAFILDLKHQKIYHLNS